MSKIIKSYNQLPPNVKQALNNMANKAASSAIKQIQNKASRVKQSQTKARTTRTRNGMRIYSPNDVVENKAIAPVSYATTWTSGNKSLRVHQTEVIGKVSANSTWFPRWNEKYTVATFPINPASPTTFPWLSYIARLYDKYRFYSLKFIYVNAVSTQTEGNIMMSLDYDTLDKAPANLVEASQLAKYKLSPLYCPAEFAVPVSHPGNNNWLYTYDLNAANNTVDLKTYNLGNFFLSLDGVPQDGKDYGYLAVEYDVELLDKNPVVSVFASKTYDSGKPAAKKQVRSNIDPADTMEITTTWDKPVSSSTTNPLTLVFSEDAPIGSKTRLVVFVAAPIVGGANVVAGGFSAPTVPDGVTILDQNWTQTGFNNTTSIEGCCLNLDLVIPEDRTITITMNTATNCSFPVLYADAYKTTVMAYTY